MKTPQQGLNNAQIMQHTAAPFISSGHRRLAQAAFKAGIEEGRKQVLFRLLAIGDENVAHDHRHPDRADFLLEVRRTIVAQLRYADEANLPWPEEWPDFEHYTWSPG